MVYTIKEQEKYYFEFGDNLKQPKDAQGYAIISLPSMLQLQEAFMNGANDQEAEFLCHIKAIHNFRLSEDGEDVTPKEVFETEGLYLLAVELKNQYKKYSVNKKNKNRFLAARTAAEAKQSKP